MYFGRYAPMLALVEGLGDALLSTGRVPAVATAVLGADCVQVARRINIEEALNLHGIGLAGASDAPRISFFAIEPSVVDYLPESIGAARVEVLQSALPAPAPPVPMPVLLSDDERDCSSLRTARQRPVRGGISCGPSSVTAGTLGCVCTSNVAGEGGFMGLSNNHVFAKLQTGQLGDVLLQPAIQDAGSSPDDEVGNLLRAAAVVPGLEHKNRVDAALVRLSVPAIPEICRIGPLEGVGAAGAGLRVRKHGRTTGYSEGVISHVGYTMVLSYGGTLTRFSDQVRIVPVEPYDSFSEGGDSGSVVVAQSEQQAVGLLFAGAIDGSYSLANRMDLVMHDLNISIP